MKYLAIFLTAALALCVGTAEAGNKGAVRSRPAVQSQRGHGHHHHRNNFRSFRSDYVAPFLSGHGYGYSAYVAPQAFYAQPYVAPVVQQYVEPVVQAQPVVQPYVAPVVQPVVQYQYALPVYQFVQQPFYGYQTQFFRGGYGHGHHHHRGRR
jgi:hypothetical protein